MTRCGVPHGQRYGTENGHSDREAQSSVTDQRIPPTRSALMSLQHTPHGASVVTTSCGALAPDSRLARLNAVVFGVMSARLTRPFPGMSDVTSTVVHVPALTDPDEPVDTAAKAGADVNTIADSLQEVSATAWTSYPVLCALLAKTRRLTWLTLPVIPCTLNRR